MLKIPRKTISRRILAPIAYTALLTGFLLTSSLHGETVLNALIVCGRCLIPSLLPFMVISELFFATPDTANGIVALCGKPFSRIFHLPPCGFVCFLAGMLFGFPLGAKFVAEYHKRGFLTDDEAKILASFTSAAGPAFVIAGVGFGMMHSWRIGVTLYFSQLIAIILFAGIVTHVFPRRSTNISPPNVKDESAVAPFRNSAVSMITVCACVLFFSLLTDIFKAILPAAWLPWVAALLEIGTATERISHMRSAVKLPLCAFSIGFGGLSVQMQIKPYINAIGGKSSFFFVSKFIQGVLTAIFFICISFLLPA